MELERLVPKEEDPFHGIHYCSQLETVRKELVAFKVRSTEETLYKLRIDTRTPMNVHKMHYAQDRSILTFSVKSSV